MNKEIQAPVSAEVVKELSAGDMVYISGTIYTARDAAHKRMDEALAEGKVLLPGYPRWAPGCRARYCRNRRGKSAPFWRFLPDSYSWPGVYT